ncbi:MAG: hypothetical protein GY763_01520 [Gammaproteobacteria bacterium]|nr:hypothetical protein [Gammaproteobacteria bacterium]
MDESSSELLSSRTACRDCAKILILSATQRVYIISQKLEPELYNDKDIYEHLGNLAASNRNTDIRIIAHDTRVAASQGHFLIHLAQRLPTFAQIRTTVTRAHRQFLESWLIVDDHAYMRIKSPALYEGNFATDNKLECKAYLDDFEEIWEGCQVDQNTRRLSL